MKFITIIGAGLLAFSSSFALSSNVFAGETIQETSNISETQNNATNPESAKPSRAELRSAITCIESFENYHTYSLLSSDELANATEFFREYTYLFWVANLAKNLDANYDNASAQDLTDVIKLAEDAVIGCRLIIGSAHKNSTPVASSTQTPSAPASNSTVTQAVATNKPQQPSVSNVNIAQTIPAETQSETTSSDFSAKPEDSTEAKVETTETTETPEDIAVPATGTAEKSNKPFFITIGAVALACLLIGSMLILNRKKSYRPGRKF